MPQKLTRTQIREGLDTIPIEQLLTSGEGKRPKITSKQKAFAHAIALEERKAQEYRTSHKAKPSKRTLRSEPYRLARDPRIAREIEAYQLALEAEKHRNPIQLKALLVQQLVQHSLDEDFPPAQRMKALQMIGNLFEVGAFLERKESTIIHKSSDIRTRLLERLGKVSDVTAKQDDGLTLLQEIRGDGLADRALDAPTDGVGAPAGGARVGAHTHTVSLIQSSNKNSGGGSQNSSDTVLDFDTE